MKIFLKERKKNRRFDRLIDFEKPNPLGIKWRFFLLSITLKSASFQNGPYIAFMTILFIIIIVSPSFYPLLAISSNSEPMYSQEEAVFPYSILLSIITPTIISTRTWIVLVVLFCLLTIISFVLCLYEPSFTLYTHVLLDIKIHQILLPWITGTIGYAVYIVSNFEKVNSIGLWYCIIPLLVFPFYLILISLLSFLEVNSIVKPNSTITGWFTTYPFWQPIVIAAISIFGYQCINWPYIAIYICGGFVILLCIFIGIWTLATSPFILFLANEILITEMFVIASFLILSIFFIKFSVSFSSISIAIVPIYSLLVFLGVHIAYQHKLSSIHQILSQINTDLEQLTTDSLQATLSPLTHQVSLQSLVKEGLISGNKAVLSEVFIQYCLDCYPNSEWFLGYIAFLYGVIWKNDPNAYRFLLHLLSLDIFSAPVEYMLFQYIYCFMQTSQTLSPMIMRRLTRYRETCKKYVIAHKVFWLSALSSETNNFQKAKTRMVRLFMSAHHQAEILKLMFPFCPSVRCELCLFEADLMHNIIKADEEYNIASSLLDPDAESVTSTLFQSFVLCFLGARITLNQQRDGSESNDYRFLSFQDHYDDAHRQGVSISVNDNYLTSLTHTFKMSRNQPQIDPKIDRIRLFFAYFLIVFAILVFIGLVIFHHYVDPSLLNSIDEIESLNGVLNATTHFRYDINRLQFDIDLLLNIANKTYVDAFEDDNFFRFVLEHLSFTESSVLSYKYLLDSLDYLNENKSIINACNNMNCTFSYLFGVLHEKCLFFLNSNQVSNLTKFEPVHNLNSATRSLSIVIDNIYNLVYNVYKSKTENMFKKTRSQLIIMIAIELFMAVVMSTLTSLLLKRMKENINDVIRTAQPPIIQYIASQFDKLLLFDKYQHLELPSFTYGEIAIPYVLMFLVLFIYPVYILFMIPNFSSFHFKKNPLPEIVNCTDETQFLYYSLAKLEYSTFASRNVPPSSYRSIVESDHSCMHDMFDSNEEESPVEIIIGNNFVKNKIVSVHSSLLLVASVVFIFFLRSAYLEISTVKIGRILLKFIPNSAAQSNPVFAKLLRGQVISHENVSEFTESIKICPSDLTFFCVICYDSSGKITKTLGDVKKYLTTEAPSTMVELNQFIIEKCKNDISVDEINSFFNNKIENDALNVSFYPGHEVSLIFSKNPDSIVIKDDSNHYETNSRMRMTKRLNRALDDSIPPSLKIVQKAVVVMITTENLINNGANVLIEIKEIIKEIKDFLIIDSRNHTIRFIINAEIDEAKACNSALSFVENNILRFIPIIKVSMAFGGPLSFFDSVKNQTTKSRCVGVSYDCAMMMLNLAETGSPMITKDIYEKAMRDTSSMNFVEKKIAFDMTIMVME